MFSYSTFEWLFLNLHNLALWLPAFCLAVLLRVITHNYHHQLIFPACKSYTGIQIPSAEGSQILSLFLSYFISLSLSAVSTLVMCERLVGSSPPEIRKTLGTSSTQSLVRSFESASG